MNFKVIIFKCHQKDNKEGGVIMTKKILPLRGLIYSKFKSEAEFAREIRWTRQRLNKITNGDRPPTLFEVEEIANGLSEDIMVIANIFFKRKVTEKATEKEVS